MKGYNVDNERVIEMKKVVVASVVAVLALVASGCSLLQMPSLEVGGGRIQHVTTSAREALEILWGLSPEGSRNTPMALRPESSQGIAPQLMESLPLIRATDAQAKGATGRGVKVLVLDDFSQYPLKDGRFHGDYVVAIIAATAPGVDIWKCDVFASDSSPQACMRDALGKGFQVVNMSWSYVGVYCVGTHWVRMPIPPASSEPMALAPLQMKGTDDELNDVEALIQQLRAEGAVVVGAAANDGMHYLTAFPACVSTLSAGAVYDAPFDEAKFRICTDENVKPDDETCWSNYGTIFAPGWRVDGLFKDGISFGGTSASTPFTSGGVALLLGKVEKKSLDDLENIEYTEADIGKVVIDNADPIPDRFKTNLPHRRLNVLRAWLALHATPPSPPDKLESFLDKNKNCRIDDDELLLALNLWITQNEWAPGKRISDSDILRLINEWIFNQNICQQIAPQMNS